MSDALQHPLPQQRIPLLIALTTGAMFLLVGRLAWLQVGEYDKHSLRAESIRLTRTLVPGRRASIVDRYGRTLAADEAVWDLQLNYWLFTEPENVLDRIAWRGGVVPGMTAQQTAELVAHLQHEKAIRDDRRISRIRRFELTWPGRLTPLVRAERRSALQQLAAIVGGDAATIEACLARVEEEVLRTQSDTKMRETDRYQRIVRLGSSPAFWNDEGRLERAAQRKRIRERVEAGETPEAAQAAEEAVPLHMQDEPLIIATGLERQAVETVIELDQLFAGISAEPRSRRVYPAGPLAAHILGYLREVERIGGARKPEESASFRRLIDEAESDVGEAFIREHFHGDDGFELAFHRQLLQMPAGVTGLERWYQDRLCGRFGASVLERDVHRRTQRVLDETDPEAAPDLRLGLDADALACARDELSRVYERIGSPGAVVAIDVWTGEILAMASFPDFDLDRLMGRTDADREYMIDLFKRGQELGSPMFNRALHASVAPGSVFKVLTAMAGATNGLIVGPDYMGTCRCEGVWQGREALGLRHGFTCHGGNGCGDLDLAHALERSCNIYFHDLAFKLGYDPLRAMAQRFGFGEQTGVDASELATWIRNRDGSMGNRQLPPTAASKAEAALMGIGQGRLLATPLQIARFMAAVATEGRLPTPMLAISEPGSEPVQIDGLDTGVWAPIHRGLEEVVEGPHGTARTVSLLRRLHAAGKTGTAQTSRKRDGKELNYAWFAGYAPADLPRIAFAVYIEDTFLAGGQVAAPVAAAVVDCLAASPDYADSFGRKARSVATLPARAER
ncbi:MAG: peptidoglycan D,D-transpeptidase FtsI family protein [Planctomycetota bacterium]